MTKAFSFDTRFSEVNLRKAGRAVRRNAPKRKSFITGWGGFIVAGILTGVISTIAGQLVGKQLAGPVSLGILIIGVILFVTISQKATIDTVREAPIRRGSTRIELSAEGYRSFHPGSEGFVRWSHIPGVVVTEDALLILHSHYEFYPIEAAAFDGPEHMEEVAQQIRAWIEAATFD